MILDEYLIGQLLFPENAVVVDCGANVGDFSSAVYDIEASVNLIAIEPGPTEFLCAEHNIGAFAKLENVALGEHETVANFYLSSEHADNSLIQINNFDRIINVPVKRLDNFEELIRVDQIFLLKIEAEGFEPEILYGSHDLLTKVVYISVDVGFERGTSHESTLPQVVNFLLNNGFQVVEVGRKRLVVLFKNENY